MLLLFYNMNMNNTRHVESLLNFYIWTMITLLALTSWKLLQPFRLKSKLLIAEGLAPDFIALHNVSKSVPDYISKAKTLASFSLWYIPLSRKKSHLWRIWTTTTYWATVLAAKRDWKMVFLLTRRLRFSNSLKKHIAINEGNISNQSAQVMSKYPRHGRAVCIQMFPRL